jgi:hypothetical protein
MSQFQSSRHTPSGRRFSAPPTTPGLLLTTGLVTGLILGLLVGWWLAPVQWTEAWPGDLSTEARAQYLAAVSESYVYRSDAEAAEIARNRLFDLNDNLAEEIAAAQRFFSDNPQRISRIAISNLAQLAQALDVQSEAIVQGDIPAAEPAADAGAAPANVLVPVTANSSDSWLNWLLVFLGAVVLVGGGVYLLGRLSQRRANADDEDLLDDFADDGELTDDNGDGFDDERDHDRPFDDYDLGGERTARPASGVRNLLTRFSRRPASALSDPDEAVDEDDEGGFDWSQDRRPARNQHPVVGDNFGFDDEGDHRTVPSGRRSTATFDEPANPFDVDESDAYTPRARRGDQPASLADLDEDAEAMFDEPYRRPNNSVAADPVVEIPTRIVPSPLKPAAGPIIAEFIFHYVAGITEYEQSYSILDQHTTDYIGECGMGVPINDGVIRDDPESVIALEVWMVDKHDTHFSLKRVLISQYVIDHKMEEAFSTDRPHEGAAILPHEGTTFRLKGPYLTLECEVQEVNYVKTGPDLGIFQSLKLEVIVRSRE